MNGSEQISNLRIEAGLLSLAPLPLMEQVGFPLFEKKKNTYNDSVTLVSMNWPLHVLLASTL